MQGCFIVFEGIDGSGKSEQVARLSRNLKKEKFNILTTVEPTKTTTIGNLIRKILYEELEVSDEALALLFAADRIDHTKKKIIPALMKGYVVISDRYVFSSLAYQGKGMSTKMKLKWLKLINQYACYPDIVYYLDIPAEIGLNRLYRGQKRFQDHTFFESIIKQERIRSEYHKVFNLSRINRSLLEFGEKVSKHTINNKITNIKNTLIMNIDGTLSKTDIEKEIYSFTLKYLHKKQVPKIVANIPLNTNILKYVKNKK